MFTVIKIYCECTSRYLCFIYILRKKSNRFTFTAMENKIYIFELGIKFYEKRHLYIINGDGEIISQNHTLIIID